SGQVGLQGLSGQVAFAGPLAVVLIEERVVKDLAEPGEALSVGAAVELLHVATRLREDLLHQIGSLQTELPMAGELCASEQQQRRAISLQAVVWHERNLRKMGC